MATIYMKQIHNIVVSENSDYSDPFIDTRQLPDTTLTLSTTGYAELRLVRAEITTGTTIEIDKYDTLDKMLIVNTDSTNEVDATWTDGDANANTQVIEAGACLDVNDVVGTTNPTLTAQSADVDCWVLLVGVRA